ncbi:MAG: helix-turn-helix transcriptional regulator [Saprospiraceae bacterium]|nr:helix-turn-helix transcriptional regulator [Saprospiraceae bacterium]
MKYLYPMWYYLDNISYFYTLKGIIMSFGDFVKAKRKASKLTQPALAEKAGVGLRFVRELEQGKESLRLDKVNQVLGLFGYEAGPVKVSPSPLINNE